MKAMNETRGARLGDPPMKVWILDRRARASLHIALLALKLMLVLHCDAARSRGRQSLVQNLDSESRETWPEVRRGAAVISPPKRFAKVAIHWIGSFGWRIGHAPSCSRYWFLISCVSCTR
jgi:hypothetical protein